MTSGYKRALGQVLHPAQFFGFLCKDANKFVADALAFHLRVGDAVQQPQKLVGGVHVHQVQVVMLPEQVQDFLGLVFAQQAVVHEDAGEAVADGPVHQDGGDRRVHPAGQGADDPPVAHLPPDGRSGGLDEGLHGPQGRQLTDAEEKVAEDHLAPGGVVHLGVKLHPVELPGPVPPPPRPGRCRWRR